MERGDVRRSRNSEESRGKEASTAGDENIEESWSENSESNEEKSQVLESMNPEIGGSKVEAFLNTKPTRVSISEPLLPSFVQRKHASLEDKLPNEYLLNKEKTSRFPAQPISAWPNQDEKTNHESVPHTRSIREDHFLHQHTIPDSISPTIPDSCLLDGNLNALNGLHETRQTDDTSAFKLEHETRRDASLDKIEFVCVTPKVISSDGNETWDDFEVEESIQDEDNEEHYLMYDSDTLKNPLQEDINCINPESSCTEPYLRHSLSVPYQDVPQPRYVGTYLGRVNDKEVILTKRPRSPVRKILPGRYDLQRGRSELMKRVNKYSTQEYLRSSKDWISEEIKFRLSSDCKLESKEWLLHSMLQVVLEEVVLMTAYEGLDIDISTFITTATTWAITELEALNSEDSITRQSSVSSGLVLPQVSSAKKFYSKRSTEKRRLLHFERQSISNVEKISHRISPWDHMTRDHAFMGVTKDYRNMRELIYEQTGNSDEFIWQNFYPDVLCHHSHELTRISYKLRKKMTKKKKPKEEEKPFLSWKYY